MKAVSIFRKGSLVATIEPDNSSVQQKAVMGENTVTLTFTLNHYVDFQIGDTCSVYSENYVLGENPTVVKTAKIHHDYTLKFESENMKLRTTLFLFLDTVNHLQETEFPFTGNAREFLQLLVDNANRVEPGAWAVGQVILTERKTLNFTGESCLAALSKIADAFATEWWVMGKVVHLTTIAINKGYTFKQGENKGLYKLTRQGIADKALVTRLYPKGSDKNLPAGYRGKRLHIPDTLDPYMVSNLRIMVFNTIDGLSYEFDFTPATGAGITGLTIFYRELGSLTWKQESIPNWGGQILPLLFGVTYEFQIRTEGGAGSGTLSPIFTGWQFTPQLTGNPTHYIEKNTGQYGVLEYTQVFDVYPHRTGKVSGVNAANIYQLLDDSMDFDLNAYRLLGTNPKISFTTGQLAGYTFDVAAYDPVNKLFTINKNKDEVNLDVPSQAFRPKIGDEYVLIDIQMPQEYIEAAEQELLTQAQSFLDKVSIPQFTYAVEIDPYFLKRSRWKVNIGDQVVLKDEQYSINKNIRVIQTTRSVVNENELTVQLADSVAQNIIVQLQAQGSTNAQNISGLQQQLLNAAVFNNTIIGDLKIQQGTIVDKDMPGVLDATGLLPVYTDPTTGRLVRVG